MSPFISAINKSCGRLGSKPTKGTLLWFCKSYERSKIYWPHCSSSHLFSTYQKLNITKHTQHASRMKIVYNLEKWNVEICSTISWSCAMQACKFKPLCNSSSSLCTIYLNDTNSSSITTSTNHTSSNVISKIKFLF